MWLLGTALNSEPKDLSSVLSSVADLVFDFFWRGREVVAFFKMSSEGLVAVLPKFPFLAGCVWLK